jgi:hypothetical protein
MRQNIDEQPVWRLEIGNRPDNFIQVYKVIRSDFTTDNWWRDKEPEPAAAIQPGRSVKINAGAKSSAKVIPKKQK